MFYALTPLVCPFKQVLLLVNNGKAVQEIMVFFLKSFLLVMLFLVENKVANLIDL